MRQIYINTMLGTTRIDYDPNDPRDIFINASICNINEVVYDHIECTNIDPEDIEIVHIFDRELARWAMEGMLEKERSMALYSDESSGEKYLRDLMGDDAYENYESQ